jgi:16S rRNA (uracil1498-N3)-methyltransferase
MHRCHVPQLAEGELTINSDEAHHMLHVLRMGVGDRLEAFDGRGALADAVIVQSGKRETRLLVDAVSHHPAPQRTLHLAVAPTKNQDRLEWLAEKATEIGIRSFIPLLCRHSERKHVNLDRIRKVVLSATRQSGGLWLPDCREPQAFDELLKDIKPGTGFIAHCRSGEKVTAATLHKQDECVVLIGPEGDFHEEEISLALHQGLRGLSLGSSRLRTETAALVAAVAFYID